MWKLIQEFDHLAYWVVSELVVRVRMTEVRKTFLTQPEDTLSL